MQTLAHGTRRTLRRTAAMIFAVASTTAIVGCSGDVPTAPAAPAASSQHPEVRGDLQAAQGRKYSGYIIATGRKGN